MTRRTWLTLVACILAAAIILCTLVLVLYWQENAENQKEYEILASDAVRQVTPRTATATPSSAPTDVPASSAPTEPPANPSDLMEETASPSPLPTSTPKPTSTPYAPSASGRHLEVNFDTLRRINPDTIAWLYLPDTSLSYPVVAANAERDEGYYLTHSHQGRSSSSGTLFIESSADPQFAHKNTLIHGHRMNSGAMFGSLYQYARQSYYEKHPLMELYTPEQNWCLRIFASYEAELGDFYAQTEFDSTSEFEDYIKRCLSASQIDTDIVPAKNDTIVTLVTCVLGDDTARRVVQGVLEKMD